MSHQVTRGRRFERARGDERGTAMVEFGLISIFFFALIFGLIDGGLLIRAHTVTSDAADDAARRGAVAAGSETADYQILKQIRATGVHRAAQLNNVVVYRVRPDSAGPLAACRGGIAVADECNVYTRAELDTPEGAFGCGSFDLDGAWCPTTRLLGGNEVGVWLDVTYETLTGVFGDIELESRSELPFERRGSAG